MPLRKKKNNTRKKIIFGHKKIFYTHHHDPTKKRGIIKFSYHIMLGGRTRVFLKSRNLYSIYDVVYDSQAKYMMSKCVNSVCYTQVWAL